MSIIRVKCVDQDLRLEDAPVISAGGVNTDYLAVEFAGTEWDGYTKYATFSRSAFLTFRVPLDAQNQCRVPNTILAEPGSMRFGVYGVKGADRRTSVVLAYPIQEGAYVKAAETDTAAVTGLSEELIADIIAEVTAANGYTLSTVDSSVSSTSTNPVQNKVLKAYIDAKVAEGGGGSGGGGTGVSVTGAEIDASGHLIITLSDTSTIDAGTAKGANGVTFVPSVSSAGVLSWTNDGSLTNPAPVTIKGANGTNGTNGTNGADGVSVTNATINASGHLIITLSNTNTIDAGLVSSGGGSGGGTAGADGVGIQSIAKTSTSGLVDTYTITLTNGGTYTFTVTNGADGTNGTNGIDGDDGATFTPSVDAAGNLSWTNDGGLANPQAVNIKGPAGSAGAPGSPGAKGTTFTPSVDSAGNLSWTNDGGLTNPATVNIKGEKGDSGATVTDSGWQALTLQSGVNAADTTFAVTPQYRKIGNRVYIKGHVKCSVPSGGTLIAILPEGYRVLYGTHYDIGECGGQRVSRIYADADGNLKCEWIQNIAGGAFTSETWIQIDMDYLTD